MCLFHIVSYEMDGIQYIQYIQYIQVHTVSVVDRGQSPGIPYRIGRKVNHLPASNSPTVLLRAVPCSFLTTCDTYFTLYHPLSFHIYPSRTSSPLSIACYLIRLPHPPPQLKSQKEKKKKNKIASVFFLLKRIVCLA